VIAVALSTITVLAAAPFGSPSGLIDARAQIVTAVDACQKGDETDPGAVVTPDARPRRDIFGGDKARHFFVSFGAVMLANGAFRSAGLNRNETVSVSVALTVTIGTAKEVRDGSRGGTFSVLDLLWDAAGAGAAALLLARTR
jgi:uncharacterized protein YfiM (DUF2279 family)